MVLDSIKYPLAALIGLKLRGLDMGKLEPFEDEIQEDITEKNEAVEMRETLEEEMEQIDREFDKIMDGLKELEGDAAADVQQELMDEKEKKAKEIEEKTQEIESIESELNRKLEQLEESLNERKDALSKVQELGHEADIDVSDAVNDINDEINRLEEDKKAILDNLRKGH